MGIYLFSINLLVFVLCGLDKFWAKTGRLRISEKLFLLFSILGGSYGMIFGMFIFHHEMHKKKMLYGVLLCLVLEILLLLFYGVADYFQILPKKSYTASDFGIEVVQSAHDENGNGIDDFTDILLGAKMEAERNPKYKSAYYEGGYPPLDEGVCTDVVIRSLLNAGYSLKDLIDEDIRQHVELYPRVEGKPDSNIDFRRVKNLKVFLDRKSVSVTLDLLDLAAWQPGDIVIFGKDYTHIAIISDKRNQKGIPYIIHNAGQPKKEEDTLERWAKYKGITGHYRFILKEQELYGN